MTYCTNSLLRNWFITALLSVASTTYVTLLLVLVSKVDSFFTPICNGSMYRGEYYDIVTLSDYYAKAQDLVMHESSGSLFFRQGDELDKRKVIGCHFESGHCERLALPFGTFTLYNDRLTDHLYIGSVAGVFRYNVSSKSFTFVGGGRHVVWRIFVTNNNVYYIDYPSYHLHLINNNTISYQLGNARYQHYFVSKHSVHYFTNIAGQLCKIEPPANFVKEGVILSHILTVRQITEDAYGVVYICAKDGIYVDDTPYRRVTKILNFGELYGLITINKLTNVKSIMAKDEFIVIYSTEKAIYKFYPSQYAKYCVKNTEEVARMASATTKTRNWVSLSVTVDYD